MQVYMFENYEISIKKDSPVHVAPACAESGEESDHFLKL
jgi:hypothetical protein